MLVRKQPRSTGAITFPGILDLPAISLHFEGNIAVFRIIYRQGYALIFPLALVPNSAVFGPRSSPRLLVHIRLLSFVRMDEADSATKTLGLNEPPLGMPTVEGSDTESEAEVTTMAVMAEPGNIDIGAESLPNTDEAEAAFAGKAAFS